VKLYFAHDLIGKPVSTFPDHALDQAAFGGGLLRAAAISRAAISFS
jgi:hypothetical protein